MSSVLFSPFALRELQLQNRIVVSPMCQYSAVDGNAIDWHLIHLGTLSQSSAGLVLIEATTVSPEGRIAPGCLGLWSDANEAALKRVLDAIRPYAASPIGIQLSHSGRKGSVAAPWLGGKGLSAEQGGWTPIAPSAIPTSPGDPMPRAMSGADIARVIGDFTAATQRAERLGLAAIELHCAHGYLLHQFLSPVANRRTDEFGGSLANRMRVPLAVFDAMRAVWPASKPLGVRVSSTDWMEHTGEPSWTLDETVTFVRELKARGVDWIDASTGGMSPLQKIPLAPGYQVPFAERIKRETGVATIGIGLITEPAHAESVVASGQADLVALARGMLWDPRWVWHAAAQLGATLVPPPQYRRAPPGALAKVFAPSP
jgi:2,4-dienoyl-CoA reductase-like NADH-dependent reductase (Old Yellow Enzyme family)